MAPSMALRASSYERFMGEAAVVRKSPKPERCIASARPRNSESEEYYTGIRSNRHSGGRHSERISGGDSSLPTITTWTKWHSMQSQHASIRPVCCGTVWHEAAEYHPAPLSMCGGATQTYVLCAR